jgi:hypothetical protein
MLQFLNEKRTPDTGVKELQLAAILSYYAEGYYPKSDDVSSDYLLFP